MWNAITSCDGGTHAANASLMHLALSWIGRGPRTLAELNNTAQSPIASTGSKINEHATLQGIDALWPSVIGLRCFTQPNGWQDRAIRYAHKPTLKIGFALS